MTCPTCNGPTYGTAELVDGTAQVVIKCFRGCPTETQRAATVRRIAEEPRCYESATWAFRARVSAMMEGGQ